MTSTRQAAGYVAAGGLGLKIAKVARHRDPVRPARVHRTFDWSNRQATGARAGKLGSIGKVPDTSRGRRQSRGAKLGRRERHRPAIRRPTGHRNSPIVNPSTDP